MLTVDQHLDDLVRHIDLVRESTLLLGKRLIEEGRKDFGCILISKGFVHDASKFTGVEWQFLHSGNDVPRDKLEVAIQQHCHTNPHHSEYWGGIENVPEIYIAEMVCDWRSRSAEFGTNLREWIRGVAVDKYKIDIEGKQYSWINKFVDKLLQDNFVR